MQYFEIRGTTGLGYVTTLVFDYYENNWRSNLGDDGTCTTFMNRAHAELVLDGLTAEQREDMRDICIVEYEIDDEDL